MCSLPETPGYFGKLCKKPTIGDAIREIEPEDIRRSHTLLYMTAVLALVVFEVVKVAGMFVVFYCTSIKEQAQCIELSM